MTTKNETLAKLQTKYAGAEFTRAAEAGDWVRAQDLAWQYGMTGIGMQIGEAAGLPCDAAAHAAWCAARKAAKAAKFATR